MFPVILKNYTIEKAETDRRQVDWKVTRLCCLTFQTGERRRFVPCGLVWKSKIGQTETGTVVLVEVACVVHNTEIYAETVAAAFHWRKRQLRCTLILEVNKI